MGKKSDKGKTVIVPDKVLRESRTKAIEGDLPYERQLYINEVRFLLQRTAEAIIEIGKRLLVIKEREEFGSFIAVVEEEIGIPARTAQRFMNAALKQKKFPEIQMRQFGASQLYTLLEAPEEDLKELEEKGVLAGHSMDELQAMSVKDMRATIKKLQAGAEKVIGKQVSKLEAKAEKLALENKDLKALLAAGDGTPTSFKEAFETAEDLYNRAVFIFTELDFDAVNGDTRLRKKYQNRVKRFHGQFQLHCNSMMEKLNG